MALMGTKKIAEYKDVLKGKVWVFPDNVDTDVISPGKYLDDIDATLKHTCDTLIKEFPSEVKEGDIIVAGRNFGCGSSRETAPIILQEKGIDPPEKVLAVTGEFRLLMDVIKQFIKDELIVDDEGMIKSTELYQQYRKWCVANGETSESHKVFGMKMKELGYQKDRKTIEGKKETYYFGLRHQ